MRSGLDGSASMDCGREDGCDTDRDEAELVEAMTNNKGSMIYLIVATKDESWDGWSSLTPSNSSLCRHLHHNRRPLMKKERGGKKR
jgi:hypothetical protein